MAKPELGTKRICGACGAKFYDLSKNPIICPKCSTVFQVVVPVSRARPEPARAVPVAPKKAPEPEVVEAAEGAEFVSLEDADAEAQGKAKPKSGDAAEGEDEIEVAEDRSPLEDAALIEQEEEGDADVTDIIGESIEKEEET